MSGAPSPCNVVALPTALAPPVKQRARASLRNLPEGVVALRPPPTAPLPARLPLPSTGYLALAVFDVLAEAASAKGKGRKAPPVTRAALVNRLHQLASEFQDDQEVTAGIWNAVLMAISRADGRW